MNELLEFLTEKKLKIDIKEFNSNAAIIEFNVFAKPSAKMEKCFVSPEGALVIQTRSRPIEGEANLAIVSDVAKVFGVGKFEVEILRGEKSRNKRIKLLLEITAKKTKKYYQEKFTSIA